MAEVKHSETDKKKGPQDSSEGVSVQSMTDERQNSFFDQLEALVGEIAAHKNLQSSTKPISPNLKAPSPFKRGGSKIVKKAVKTFRIVLVGRTGEGKSSTGNLILGRRGFKAKAAAASVTPECTTETCFLDGRKVMLVDTPGLFDTVHSNEIIQKEILKFVAITSPGPHAIVLTMAIGRYTAEVNETYKYIKKMLGNNADRHTMILFTGKDNLEADGITMKEYMDRIPTGLSRLVGNVGYRYMAVNNRVKLDGPQRMQQVNQIMKMVEDLLEVNRGSVYTSEVYAGAETALKGKTKDKDDNVRELSLQKAITIKGEIEDKAKELEKLRSDKNTRDTSLVRKKEDELGLIVEEGEEKVRNIKEECEDKLEENRDELREDILTEKVSVQEPWFASKMKTLRRFLLG